jgi:hypothetical protein
MIHALSDLLRPGGVVSILAKNATALAMRPALEGRYKEVLCPLRAERDVGVGGQSQRTLQVHSTADPPGGTQEAHPGMILHETVEIVQLEDVLSHRELLGCTHWPESGR